MLMCIVCRGCQRSAELMAKDLQTSGLQISSGIYSIKPHSRFMITVTIKHLFFFSLLCQFLINPIVMSSNDVPSISSPLLSYPALSYTATASNWHLSLCVCFLCLSLLSYFFIFSFSSPLTSCSRWLPLPECWAGRWFIFELLTNLMLSYVHETSPHLQNQKPCLVLYHLQVSKNSPKCSRYNLYLYLVPVPELSYLY